MTFEEKTLESEIIYKGAVLNLRKDKVTVKNGTSYREIIEHSGGAVIVAVKDNGNVLMVRQYRKASNRVMFELPAGKLDPGEEPAEAAARELREETGYRAGKTRYITEFYPTVGYSEELLRLFLCTDLTPGETDFDENEAITIEEHPLDELYSMVMNGQIRDGKTQIGILIAKGLHEAGQLQEC